MTPFMDDKNDDLLEAMIILPMMSHDLPNQKPRGFSWWTSMNFHGRTS